MSDSMHPVENEICQWQFSMVIQVKSPLHVGDGNTDKHRIKKSGNTEPPEVQTVLKDFNDRACLPGTSLKGALRARLREYKQRDAKIHGIWNALLGSLDADSSTAVGGKLEFHNAYVSRNFHSPQYGPESYQVPIDQRPPHWNLSKMTGVSVHVCLDRRSRTAADQLLYHLEFVPPGVEFAWSLTGDFLTNEEAAAVVAFLNRFDENHPLQLGSGASHGWGEVFFKDVKANTTTRLKVREWINAQPRIEVGGTQTIDVCQSNELSERNMEDLIRAGLFAIQIPSPALLKFHIQLNFSSPFLVNDAYRTGPSDEGKFNFEPRLDPKGRVLLPGTSMHGVLRSRAEMILRTLALNTQKDPWLEAPSPGSVTVNSQKDLPKLQWIDKVFGASGWRSPLTCTDLKGEYKPHEQEFVAIDRFTGGSADTAKFRARAALNPILEGIVVLEVDRMDEAWALGLIALVMRDLTEEDLCFGFGASKGFGRCTAEISVENTATLNLKAWFQSSEVQTGLKQLRRAFAPPQNAPKEPAVSLK